MSAKVPSKSNKTPLINFGHYLDKISQTFSFEKMSVKSDDKDSLSKLDVIFCNGGPAVSLSDDILIVLS